MRIFLYLQKIVFLSSSLDWATFRIVPRPTTVQNSLPQLRSGEFLVGFFGFWTRGPLKPWVWCWSWPKSLPFFENVFWLDDSFFLFTSLEVLFPSEPAAQRRYPWADLLKYYFWEDRSPFFIDFRNIILIKNLKFPRCWGGGSRRIEHQDPINFVIF